MSSKPTSMLAGKPICIRVGKSPARKEFFIHKTLLSHYSEYFRAALNGSFKEATKNVIVLDDEEPDIFELFQKWIYHRGCGAEMGKLKEVLFADVLGQPWDSQPRTLDHLACLWIFGEKRIIVRLQDDVITMLHQHYPQLGTFCMFHKPLQTMSTDSAIVRFFTTFIAMEEIAWHEKYPKKFDCIPKNWLPVVANLWRDALSKGRWSALGTDNFHEIWSELDLCMFHLHLEGEQCWKLNGVALRKLWDEHLAKLVALRKAAEQEVVANN